MHKVHPCYRWSLISLPILSHVSQQESHWASAFNGGGWLDLWEAVVHQTQLKSQPQLSELGPPKQWRNTQQAYVTNLLKQLLTLKHRRWRPWEHYTVIESTHALVLAYNDPEERSSQPHLLWSPVIPAIWKLKLSLKASSHRSSFALNCVNK